MALALFAGALLVLHSRHASATPDHPSQRPYGRCQQFSIPITATAESAVYQIPRVDNDLEATAWAVWDSTRTTRHGPASIIRNTTTSGTFKIHAQLCFPRASTEKKDVLQIATHGEHYDSRYWDSAYKPEEHSYVNAALKAGYSILTYDRLGVGQSDHPDAYTDVQAPLELEILRRLTLMARNGTLFNLACNMRFVAPTDSPSKIVHVGHSFGSFLTTAFIARYANLTNGAIITGYILSQYLGSAGSTAFSVEYAGKSYNRSSGYVVSKKNGIQDVFFGGDPKTAFTPDLLDCGDSIKQPVPVGEFASAYSLIGLPAVDFEGPVQYVLPENDFYVCRGDCKGLTDVEMLKEMYPRVEADDIEVVIQPNTGHALPLHRNATAGFELTFDFLRKRGL